MSKRIIYSLGEGDDRDAYVFEVEDLQYNMVVGNLMRDGVDLDDALERALAMLAAVVRLNEEDIEDDVLSAQSVAVATVWFLFNEAADEEDRVQGDVVLVEKDGDIYVAELIEPEIPDNT
jgi:hypothetical protein